MKIIRTAVMIGRVMVAYFLFVGCYEENRDMFQTNVRDNILRNRFFFSKQISKKPQRHKNLHCTVRMYIIRYEEGNSFSRLNITLACFFSFGGRRRKKGGKMRVPK